MRISKFVLILFSLILSSLACADSEELSIEKEAKSEITFNIDQFYQVTDSSNDFYLAPLFGKERNLKEKTMCPGNSCSSDTDCGKPGSECVFGCCICCWW